MSILTIDAHCIDKEFETRIQTEYGVAIVSMEGAPWAVVFEGPREKLAEMVDAEWGENSYTADEINDMIGEV